MRFVAPGITIELPDGWEAEVDSGAGVDDVALATPRTHIANFPLPAERGDYGSGAVEVMRRGDVLLCILEEHADAARSVLHDRATGPGPLPVTDFHADAMQRPRAGQSGTQSFFRVGDRAFVLYAVLAERVDRGSQVDELNRVLAGVSFD